MECRSGQRGLIEPLALTGTASVPAGQVIRRTKRRNLQTKHKHAGPARLQGRTTCSPWHQNNTTTYRVPVLRTDRLPCGLVGAPVTQKLGWAMFE